MDYISHKGDRGHDSTETVGSSGRGEAGEGWPGAGLSARSPQAREVRGFWKLPGVEGLQRGKKGSKARPEARTPAPGAAGPSRALVEDPAGCRAGDGPLGLDAVSPPSQTEILHFQAAGNIKFPCSGLECHHRCVARRLSRLIRPRLGSWGMSLINFFKRETEIIIT